MIQYGIRNKVTGHETERTEDEARSISGREPERYELIEREVGEWRKVRPIIVTLTGGNAPYQLMQADRDEDGREQVTLRAMTVDEAIEAGWSPGA